MDTEIESIDMADIRVDARSFSWTVDSAIRSETGSNLGASPVHSFGSVVDSAIRSRTPSNLGTSPVRSFVSAVDNAMMRLRTVATRFSQVEVVSNRTEHVVARLFTWAELKAATKNFSFDNKIGAGSCGVVYRGKLVDGREVTIRRGKKTNYLSDFGKREFAILSRLQHRNLVRLVGYCEKKDERLWVYEYMKNGSLYDHLHDEGSSTSVLNSWKMRIKIALDASREIRYLHNYAVPSIIHRDIKSRNILLDATWTACVFDFERSLMSPEPDHEHDEEVAGTFGYVDPEYLWTSMVTAKSDVYAFGVVLLELLTGKKPSVDFMLSPVGFALPAIFAGDWVKILDPRVGPPDVNEAQALKLLAYTAICCVKWEGKDRPTMVDIVVNLKRALAICDSNSYDENFSSPLLKFSTTPLNLFLFYPQSSIDAEGWTHILMCKTDILRKSINN